MSSEWDPAKYEDPYQTAVRELIEAKVQNRPKTAKPLAPPSRGAGLDIVAILQESIRESAETRKKAPGRPAGTRRVIACVVARQSIAFVGRIIPDARSRSVSQAQNS